MTEVAETDLFLDDLLFYFPGEGDGIFYKGPNLEMLPPVSASAVNFPDKGQNKFINGVDSHDVTDVFERHKVNYRHTSLNQS